MPLWICGGQWQRVVFHFQCRPPLTEIDPLQRIKHAERLSSILLQKFMPSFTDKDQQALTELILAEACRSFIRQDGAPGWMISSRAYIFLQDLLLYRSHRASISNMGVYNH